MTTPSNLSDDAPRLPSAEPVPPTATPAAPSSDAPFLPAAVPVATAEAEPQTFDAKAMVEATKHRVDKPAYGGLPQATPESLAAANALRAKAKKKRQRNRMLAWVVAVTFLGVVASAGWFAYRAYQDDQDKQAAERVAAQAEDDGTDSIVPGALSPLGEQQQVIEAMEDINSSDAQLSGGGLRDIADQAQAAVDDSNGVTADTAPAPPPDSPVTALAIADVLPSGAVAAGTRLEDADGFERYVVDTTLWTDIDEYQIWLETMLAQPQLNLNSPAFDVFPPIRKGQVGIAIRRNGEQLVRAIVVGLDPDLHVDTGS